ncbi:MAG TPA: M23 family metallopeptidase [Gemmatimonadales bacterium]|nr:M23 family metallopeptidase [Gemmatimonadales bacterium]
MKRLGQSITRASVSAIVISHLASCASAQSDDRKQAADANQAKLNDCSLYPSQHSSPYVLPYEAGTEHLVWRGREHFVRGNGGVGLYAYDFEMPVGTKLLAVRSGEVVALREEFRDGNGEDLKENFLMIKHEDGSVARYMHLTHNGVLVKKGDRVKVGQVVALSGNTGDTGGGAHLHFDVQQCGPNMPPHYNQLPCGQTLPITFRNTRPHRCGLVSNERYRASP